MKAFFISLRCVTTAALLLCSLAAHPASYTITSLGFTPVDSNERWTNYVRDINNSGQVVGYGVQYNGSFSPTGVSYGFLYKNGALINLGTLGGNTSHATGINDHGQVVGVSMTADGVPHGFLYDNGTMTDLGAGVFPVDINDNGQIAGLTDFGDLPINSVNGINNQGQVVGAFRQESGLESAFLYDNGTVTDLNEALGGVRSRAHDINDHGQIVGGTFPSTGTPMGYNAFLYDNGTMIDLGNLSLSTEAYGINNLGQVVGSACPRLGPCMAFLYSEGQMTSLDNLLPADSGWNSLHFAEAINDTGQIIGSGSHMNNQGAYLLSPVSSVPLPATVWLFISGLLGLTGMSRRSKKSTNALAAG